MDESFESRFVTVLESVGRKNTAPKKLREDEPTEQIETVESDDSAMEEKAGAVPISINLFQHPESHPLALDLALLRKYGPEWMIWDAETVAWRIPQDFRTTDISDLNMNKIQAVKTLHVVDTYWKQWEIFNWCTPPLNGMFTDFEMMQVPSVGQCLVSVDIANKVRTDVAWSDEVKLFVSTVFRNDGIFCPIEPIDFISVESEGLMVDCGEVKERWPEVRKTGKAPMGDTIVEEQLRRALDVHRFLEENRETLRQQLPMVLND
jgi:hypothetical protein